MHSHSGASQRSKPCTRLLLIVIFNWPNFQHIPFIRKLYGEAVTKIVYYSDEENRTLGVHRVGLSHGAFQHVAISDAMRRYPDFDGYLWIADDIFFNYPAVFSRRNFLNVWTYPYEQPVLSVNPSTETSKVPYDHWHVPWGKAAAKESNRCVPTKYKDRFSSRLACRDCVVKGGSDIGYVPRRLVPVFMELSYVYRHVFFEIAIPTMLRVMVGSVNSDIETFQNGLYIWGPSSQKADKARRQWKVENAFVHSTKYSNPAQKADAVRWMADSRKKFVNVPATTSRVCSVSTVKG
eukprot:scpid55032/ scgid32919/ 